MDALTHAHLAQTLIAACDGVDAIVRQKACRIGSTQLYASMDHGSGYFLPADVICCLEQYCGEPHYSRALFEYRPAASEIADMATEACELTEAAALLQAKARDAMRHPRGPTPRQKAELHGLALTAMEEAREIAAATESGAQVDAAPAPKAAHVRAVS